MYYHRFTIKHYKIILVGDENGIAQLMIDNDSKSIQIDKKWEEEEESLFAEARQQLNEYFGGKRTHFDLKLNPAGTDYQKQVWQLLQQIPYGALCSYKQLAEKTGNPKGSRAVGMANNKNPIPIIIPCHRVVGTDKKLVGYAYGLECKKALIESEKINTIFLKLVKYYGDIHRNGWGGKKTWWPANSPFQMMTGAILTQNTNWKNVEKALANFGDKLSPQFIQELENIELAELIRPSGYHNQKAKKLKALCDWFEKYDFDTNKASACNTASLRKELLEVNGVGGETADSILVYALNKTSFVIDAYTRRIFGRVGIEVPKNYDTFREKLENTVPNNITTYDYYHGLIVEHAKVFCTKTPKCEHCPLEKICDKTEVSGQIALNFK